MMDGQPEENSSTASPTLRDMFRQRAKARERGESETSPQIPFSSRARKKLPKGGHFSDQVSLSAVYMNYVNNAVLVLFALF